VSVPLKRLLTRPTSAAVVPTFSQMRRPGFPAPAPDLVITLPLVGVEMVTFSPVCKSRSSPVSLNVLRKTVDWYARHRAARKSQQSSFQKWSSVDVGCRRILDKCQNWIPTIGARKAVLALKTT